MVVLVPAAPRMRTERESQAILTSGWLDAILGACRHPMTLNVGSRCCPRSRDAPAAPRRAALGTGKRAAGEARDRWIDARAEREESPGRWGWDENDAAAARALAGEPDEENGA